MFLVSLVFLANINNLQSLRTVLVSNQTEPVLVVEGRTVRMSCRTDKKWFFCLWTSPGEDKQCAIQYSQAQRVCRQSNRTKIVGGEDSCDVQLQVRTPSMGYFPSSHYPLYYNYSNTAFEKGQTLMQGL